MNKENLLLIASVILVILGLLIGSIGLLANPILLPPAITGVGFLVIAVVFYFLRRG